MLTDTPGGGQNWTPMVGHFSMLFDKSASIPALVALPFTFASKAPSIGLMGSNRYAMDIPADFDEAALARLLSVLESRC